MGIRQDPTDMCKRIVFQIWHILKHVETAYSWNNIPKCWNSHFETIVCSISSAFSGNFKNDHLHRANAASTWCSSGFLILYTLLALWLLHAEFVAMIQWFKFLLVDECWFSIISPFCHQGATPCLSSFTGLSHFLNQCCLACDNQRSRCCQWHSFFGTTPGGVRKEWRCPVWQWVSSSKNGFSDQNSWQMMYVDVYAPQT